MEDIALIFPGQGAQFVGMGKDLYDNYTRSKAVFDSADKALGFSISRLCFAGPPEELTSTRNCQLAIFTVSIAALEAFMAVSRTAASSVRYAAGLSLGEYSALVAAGILSFESGLNLVRKRAELMDAAARRNPGKMAAILGLDRKIVEDACNAAGAQIANINCPGQIVITGRKEAVDKAKDMAMQNGAKRAIDLEVSGAFHSSLMQEAAGEFKNFLEWFELKETRIPVVSNVTALPQYKVQDIRSNLYKQISSPVLWEDSVRFMAAQGVKVFYEIGPGCVLKGLIRKIDPAMVVKNIGSLKDMSEVKDAS